MIQMNDLFQEFVAQGKLRGVRRFNLRKYFRSFDLPPCALSFIQVDALELNGLSQIKTNLPQTQITFLSGENFPRSFWDLVAMGQEKRTEFLFLTTGSTQHRGIQLLLHKAFSENMRCIGEVPPLDASDCESLQAGYRCNLLQDLIHFSKKPELQSRVGDFYLALYCLTFLDPPPEVPTRESIFRATMERYPAVRSAMARALSASYGVDRLNELLALLPQLPAR